MSGGAASVPWNRFLASPGFLDGFLDGEQGVPRTRQGPPDQQQVILFANLNDLEVLRGNPLSPIPSRHLASLDRVLGLPATDRPAVTKILMAAVGGP